MSLIRRIARLLRSWTHRPRFDTPGLGIAVALAIAVVLLVFLTGRPKAAPTPPPSLPERPLPAPKIELPPREATPASEPPAAVQGGCPKGCDVQPPDCYIKGNVSSRGERIYHVPGGGSYAATVISPERGEAWFCTEGEAQANGWRRSKR